MTMNSQKMLALILLLLMLVTGCARNEKMAFQKTEAEKGVRSIVDMAGRTVAIPANIKKVYGASPTGTILIYTIEPDFLLGWNYYMDMEEVAFVVDKYRNLPVLGGWFGKETTANLEDLMRIKPDVIITMEDPPNPELADKIQADTGIPVVLVDGNINRMEEAYIFAGKVLNREERCTELAAYCHETMSLARQKKALIAGRKPVKVYYAEGSKGLETEPQGSWHAQLIEYVGGVNVAGVNLSQGSKLGRSPVSFEQILMWNPQVVLIGYFRQGETSSYAQITSDENWREVDAVQNHRVYEIPTQPFNWFDRPPGINRLIGIRWLGNLLYPDVYVMDIRNEVRQFYSLFYHYKLTEQDLDKLLQRVQ